MPRSKKKVTARNSSTFEEIQDDEDDNPELIRPTTGLHLAEHQGDGEMEGVPFRLATNIDGSPLIYFGKEPTRNYILPIKKFIILAYELDKKLQDEKEKAG